jgi:hypothetical protein
MKKLKLAWATNAMYEQQHKSENRSPTDEGHHGHGSVQFLCTTGTGNSARKLSISLKQTYPKENRQI